MTIDTTVYGTRAVEPKEEAMSVDISRLTGKNSLYVTPDDLYTLQQHYNWLISSDRDDIMGTLSATNRRTLLLGPGAYTDNLTGSTDYVDVVMSSNGQAFLGGTISLTGDAVYVYYTANDTLNWNGMTLFGTVGFDVTGNLLLTGDLDVTGTTTLTGDVTITGDLDVTGDTTLTGNLTVTKTISEGSEIQLYDNDIQSYNNTIQKYIID